MIFIASFIIELFILYLLSGRLINVLWHLIYKFTKNKKYTIYILAVLFFPGTFIHELSHWLTANLLFVRTGEVNLWPQINGNRVRFGSVSVAKTDHLRRFIIGIAPVLIGILIIMIIFHYIFYNNLFNNTWQIIIAGYIVFETGNTMFSSKKDMECAFELFLTVLIASIILYFAGFRIPLSDIEKFITHPAIVDIFQKGAYFFLFIIFIDAVFIFISKNLFLKFLNRQY